MATANAAPGVWSRPTRRGVVCPNGLVSVYVAANQVVVALSVKFEGWLTTSEIEQAVIEMEKEIRRARTRFSSCRSSLTPPKPSLRRGATDRRGSNLGGVKSARARTLSRITQKTARERRLEHLVCFRFHFRPQRPLDSMHFCRFVDTLWKRTLVLCPRSRLFRGYHPSVQNGKNPRHNLSGSP